MGTIEAATSNRSSCRICRKPIAKDTLRHGESSLSDTFDGAQQFWYHLECAATKRPEKLQATLETFRGAFPDRKRIEDGLAQAIRDVRLEKILRAELAPSGQAKCIHCKEPIEKSSVRLAIHIDDDPTMPSTSFLHLDCADAWTSKHSGLAKKLETLLGVLSNARCPSCNQSTLSFLAPAKHQLAVGQLACAKCGGMFDLDAVDSRKKPALKPKAKPKAKAKSRKRTA